MTAEDEKEDVTRAETPEAKKPAARMRRRSPG